MGRYFATRSVTYHDFEFTIRELSPRELQSHEDRLTKLRKESKVEEVVDIPIGALSEVMFATICPAVTWPGEPPDSVDDLGHDLVKVLFRAVAGSDDESDEGAESP